MDGVWTPEQIRAAERAAMAGLPEGQLMARAAAAVATETLRVTGFAYGAKVLLLVGSGDNGGDALYAGVALARRGALVHALLAVPDKAHPNGLAAFRAAGGRLVTLDEASSSYDVVVDGLVGIGATGALRESLVPYARWAQESPAPVVSVDIPSGVDPNTGAVAGEAVTATVTVCPGALKPGLVVGEGNQRAGRVVLVDIGIAEHLEPAGMFRLAESDVRSMLRHPGAGDDKYTRGVVGVVAGSAQYPGAAVLAVGSARLGGTGAVRYAGHAAREVVRRFPDVLATDTPREAGKVQAWAVGPGLGSADDAGEHLEFVLSQDVPVVVDADGLNLLAEHRDWLRRRTAPTVLTPHDREFERLFGEIGPDRVGAARRAAAGAGATVLLKGSATVIADPSGACLVNDTGSSVLATAGSGDVLTGLLGSLLAADAAGGHDLPAPPGLGAVTRSAATAAYLHGRAGSVAARQGPVTAPDLHGALRSVLDAFS